MVDMNDVGEIDGISNNVNPDDYILIDVSQDRESAYRWHIANQIRRGSGGSQEKIIKYLRANVGKEISGEELSYVAKSSEWARRVRELRTEEGWPISTRMSGNPALPVGVYVLEVDRQTPPHDRHIPEALRREILRRDAYACQKCGWTHDLWNPSDPRFLELHHKIHHAKGGSSDSDNLITYCNVCHDDLHTRENSG
jgi:hypothetical protein